MTALKPKTTPPGASGASANGLPGQGATWKPVPGYNYEVSSEGAVRRTTAFRHYPVGHLLTQKVTTNGYQGVTLSRNGRPWHTTVNVLVALAFHGPKPSPQHEAAHWDGVKANNTPDNIRWATKSENSLDRLRHGTVPDRKGEKHPMVKLTDDLVATLRRRKAGGVTYKSLARETGHPRLTIYDAVRGVTWSHLPGAVGRIYRHAG